MIGIPIGAPSQSPEPKSAWTGSLAPIARTTFLEFERRGSLLTGLFQTFVSGKSGQPGRGGEGQGRRRRGRGEEEGCCDDGEEPHDLLLGLPCRPVNPSRRENPFAAPGRRRTRWEAVPSS